MTKVYTWVPGMEPPADPENLWSLNASGTFYAYRDEEGVIYLVNLTMASTEQTGAFSLPEELRPNKSVVLESNEEPEHKLHVNPDGSWYYTVKPQRRTP